MNLLVRVNSISGELEDPILRGAHLRVRKKNGGSSCGKGYTLGRVHSRLVPNEDAIKNKIEKKERINNGILNILDL